jgi:cysteine synthase
MKYRRIAIGIVDVFVAGIGTVGTISGAGYYSQYKNNCGRI